jgi:hypothetical protein
MQIDVFADIASTGITTTHSIVTNSYVTGTTVQSGITTYADSNTANNTLDAVVAGQTIAYAAGTFAEALSPSTPVAAIVYANNSVDLGSYDLTATNDSYTVSEVTVTFGGLPTSLQTVILKDGGTTIGSQPAATSVTFTGLSILVGANQVKTITVSATTGNVGAGSGATGENITVTLSSVKKADSQGTVTTDTSLALAGSATYAYKAVPQIDSVALPSTVLGDGNMVLAKFQVQGQGGTVGWKQIVFTVTKTNAIGITGTSLWDMTTGQQVTLTTNTIAGTLAAGAGTSGTVTMNFKRTA